MNWPIGIRICANNITDKFRYSRITPSVMTQVSVGKKMGALFQTINQRYIPVVRTILRRLLRNIRNNFDFMLYSLALPIVEMTRDGR